MKFKMIVHEAEEGGFWAEIPAIPGCMSQGETMEELIKNIREALEGCLLADIPLEHDSKSRVLEVAI